jgi:hypothetical protein
VISASAAPAFASIPLYGIKSTSFFKAPDLVVPVVTAVQPGVQAAKSNALTDYVEFIPYNGIEANAGAADALIRHYICMSRNVYE